VLFRSVRDILPGRFAILMWLAIAWLVAVAIDAAMRWMPHRFRWFPVALIATTLVPLLPGPVAPTQPLPPTPSFFTTSLDRMLPTGSTVMIAPMATVRHSAAEIWQIKARMRFRQVGGYVLHPTSNGAPTLYPSATTLTALFHLNESGRTISRPAVTPEMLTQARQELRRTGAQFFIVGYARRGETELDNLARELLGPPTQRLGGVEIWELRPHARPAP